MTELEQLVKERDELTRKINILKRTTCGKVFFRCPDYGKEYQVFVEEFVNIGKPIPKWADGHTACVIRSIDKNEAIQKLSELIEDLAELYGKLTEGK